jgi:hypothetical protein
MLDLLLDGLLNELYGCLPSSIVGLLDILIPKRNYEVILFNSTGSLKAVRTCEVLTTKKLKSRNCDFSEVRVGDKVAVPQFLGRTFSVKKISKNKHVIEIEDNKDIDGLFIQYDYCNDCKYYHGEFYGNNYLHCNPHPITPDNVLECGDRSLNV